MEAHLVASETTDQCANPIGIAQVEVGVGLQRLD
jgi:hypothetical protein